MTRSSSSASLEPTSRYSGSTLTSNSRAFRIMKQTFSGLISSSTGSGFSSNVGMASPQKVCAVSHRGMAFSWLGRNAAPRLDTLPKPRLLIEPVDLDAAEIGFRDDANDLVVLDDRDVAAARMVHQAEGIDGRARRGNAYGLRGHHIGERRRLSILALGDDASDRIAPRKNADEPVVLVCNQHRTDFMLAHALAGMLHARAGPQRHGMLIPNDIG